MSIPSPAESAAHDYWSIEELNELLDRLPDLEATVLRLVYFRSLTVVEAAAQLKVEISTANGLAARALRHLAEHLLDGPGASETAELTVEDPTGSARSGATGRARRAGAHRA